MMQIAELRLLEAGGSCIDHAAAIDGQDIACLNIVLRRGSSLVCLDDIELLLLFRLLLNRSYNWLL